MSHPSDGSPGSVPRATPRWRHPAVRIAGSIAILAALFAILPLDELRDAVGRVPASLWPVALATYLTLHLIGVVKWRLLINAAGAGLSMRDAIRAYYWGLFGNTFLPSIVGGDVVRAGMAMRTARSTAALVMGSLVDRLQDIVGLATVAGVGALLSPRALSTESRTIFLTLGAVLAALGVGGLVGLAVLPVRRLPWKVRKLLVKVRTAVQSVTRQPRAMGLAFLAGVALQGLLVVLNWWLGRIIGIEIPLYVWLFVWPLAKISGLLPVTQGGIGVREAAQAALFAPFGVSAVHAVATGLVFEVIIIAGGLCGGVIALALGARRAPAAPLTAPNGVHP